MKIMIEPAGEITHLDGVPVRPWKGTTDEGVPCIVYVHRLAVRDDQDTSAFERALAEQAPPSELTAPELRETIRWLAQTFHQAHHESDFWYDCPKHTCDRAAQALKVGKHAKVSG
jgi:hypothetical protein